MIIDLIEGRNGIMRYTADIAPHIGETISTFIDGEKTWRVVGVDHLIAVSAMGRETEYLQLITVQVKAA